MIFGIIFMFGAMLFFPCLAIYMIYMRITHHNIPPSSPTPSQIKHHIEQVREEEDYGIIDYLD